jgi:hypothetical protein
MYFLSQCVNKWIEFEIKKKISKFEILNSWIVRQFENEYNPTHIGIVDIFQVLVF